jgi:hypothetical protein
MACSAGLDARREYRMRLFSLSRSAIAKLEALRKAETRLGPAGEIGGASFVLCLKTERDDGSIGGIRARTLCANPVLVQKGTNRKGTRSPRKLLLLVWYTVRLPALFAGKPIQSLESKRTHELHCVPSFSLHLVVGSHEFHSVLFFLESLERGCFSHGIWAPFLQLYMVVSHEFHVNLLSQH